jgi:hypothetical protein
VTRPPRLGSRSVRVELGLFAFVPVLVLLAIRSRHEWLWWCFAVPAAVGVVVAVGAAVVVARTNSEPYTFDAIEDASEDVLGHVGSYLLPVVLDVGKSAEEVVIAAVVLALIIQVHIVTGRVHVNPLLYVLGYRIYHATTDTGVAYYLVAKSDVSTWSEAHRCAPLGSSVLVERRRDAGANPRQRPTRHTE